MIYIKYEVNIHIVEMYSHAHHVHNVLMYYIRLVGRECEVRELELFIQENVTNATPASIYVSGAPGTGKSASLTHIITKLKVC